jgi:hypothetical protein
MTHNLSYSSTDPPDSSTCQQVSEVASIALARQGDVPAFTRLFQQYMGGILTVGNIICIVSDNGIYGMQAGNGIYGILASNGHEIWFHSLSALVSIQGPVV